MKSNISFIFVYVFNQLKWILKFQLMKTNTFYLLCMYKFKNLKKIKESSFLKYIVSIYAL